MEAMAHEMSALKVSKLKHEPTIIHELLLLPEIESEPEERAEADQHSGRRRSPGRTCSILNHSLSNLNRFYLSDSEARVPGGSGVAGGGKGAERGAAGRGLLRGLRAKGGRRGTEGRGGRRQGRAEGAEGELQGAGRTHKSYFTTFCSHYYLILFADGEREDVR